MKNALQNAIVKQNGPVLVLRPLKTCRRSKKGFITDVIVDFYAYVVFVLVIIIFGIIFKLSADAKKQRLQDVQGVTDGNFMIQVLLREPIDVGRQKMTYADLLVLYDYNQSKELALKAQQSTAQKVVEALPYAAGTLAAATVPLGLPLVVPAIIGSSILFGDENLYYKNIDSLTTDFLTATVESNPRYQDKCYYLIIRGSSFLYTKVSDRCSGDYSRDELFTHLKDATIPFGREGALGAQVASGSGTIGAAAFGAGAASLVLGPGALLGGALLGYVFSGFQVDLCKIPQSSYLTYLPNLDPRVDNLVVLFMLDVPRLAQIYPGDGGQCVKEEKKAPAPASASGLPLRAGTFYGLTIEGANVVFILDRSDSMLGKSKQGNRKFEVLQAQTKAGITGMNDTQSFSIIFFSKEVSDSMILNLKDPVPATEEAKEAAYKFIDEIRPEGATNLYDALKRGLAFPTVDTIYFLTDGGHDWPTMLSRSAFEPLAKNAKNKGIRIFTIGIGKDADVALLRMLAEMTGGKFVEAEPEGTREADAVVAAEAQRLGIEVAFASTIMDVESGGKFFDNQYRIMIRMEPHVFNEKSGTDAGSWRNKGKGRGDGEDKLSDRVIGDVSCEGGQNSEYTCFEKAKALNRVAAYHAISMGAGQVMGFNSNTIGYASAEAMFNSFQSSAAKQAEGMFRFIESHPKLLEAARQKDFDTFAEIYNGDRTGRYAGRLQSVYNAKVGAPPPTPQASTEVEA